MTKKKISEVSTEKLAELLQSLKNESEALLGTISHIETEIFFRENPELKNTMLDFYVEVYD